MSVLWSVSMSLVRCDAIRMRCFEKSLNVPQCACPVR